MTRCLIIDLQPLNSMFVFLDIKNLVFNLNLYETPQKHFRNLNKSISNIKIAYSHIKKNQSNKKKTFTILDILFTCSKGNITSIKPISP
jgi:septation ring formation regulator EzrA